MSFPMVAVAPARGARYRCFVALRIRRRRCNRAMNRKSRYTGQSRAWKRVLNKNAKLVLACGALSIAPGPAVAVIATRPRIYHRDEGGFWWGGAHGPFHHEDHRVRVAFHARAMVDGGFFTDKQAAAEAKKTQGQTDCSPLPLQPTKLMIAPLYCTSDTLYILVCHVSQPCLLCEVV